MKFLDEIFLDVQAGNGGNGNVSFNTFENNKADGGDGGDGGSVFFVGDTGVNTLIKIRTLGVIKAQNGQNGQNKNKHGKNGKDVFVKVPIGTVVYEGKKLVCDVLEENKYLIVKGGHGGKGNARFRSSRNPKPTVSNNGGKGGKLKLKLEIKFLADIGFVGPPSVGKSTVLAQLSNAKPKIAAYKFTTLFPHLGVVQMNEENSFLVADLPGIIKKASAGKGLGFKFLKHIERCKIIAIVLDFGSPGANPVRDYLMIAGELRSYSKELATRKKVLVANKNDLAGFSKNRKEFQQRFPHTKVIEVSALKKSNMRSLRVHLWKLCKKTAKSPGKDVSEEQVVISLKQEDIVIEHPFTGFFKVSGAKVEEIYNKIPLNTYGNIQRFNKLMKAIGLWQELERRGVQNGDTVQIFNYEMEWIA